MPKKTNTSIPATYPVCVHADCPLASTCLHQQAYAIPSEDVTYLQLINPRKCSKDGQCKFYNDAKPVRFARGFTNFQKKMFPDQYQTFMWALIPKFGRNKYFMLRRGVKLLSPQQQEIVYAALRKAGVTERLEFDKYEEDINWHY